MTTTATDIKALATRYLEAVGAKDYGAVAQALTTDLAFKGPFMRSHSSDAFIESLKRMAPIWGGNRIREVFAEGDRACVIYDFVSTTQAGSMPCIELLTFDGDRIRSVELFFDRAQFAPAAQALQQKARQ